MVLLAVFNILLSRLSGREEIVVGTPTAGRRHEDIRQLIGVFVNTLALKNRPAGELTFSEFLNRVKEKTLNAFDNQDYPYEKLVEKTGVKRDSARNPLFDVMFVFQNRENPGMNLSGVTVTPFEHENNISKFDLSFMGIDDGDNLFVSFEYSTPLFKDKTIERFVNYFKTQVRSF